MATPVLTMSTLDLQTIINTYTETRSRLGKKQAVLQLRYRLATSTESTSNTEVTKLQALARWNARAAKQLSHPRTQPHLSVLASIICLGPFSSLCLSFSQHLDLACLTSLASVGFVILTVRELSGIWVSGEILAAIYTELAELLDSTAENTRA